MLRHAMFAAAAVTFVMAAAPASQAAAPQASGEYRVHGACPSLPKPYSGTVRVEPPKAGRRLSTLTWTVDGDTLTGRALDDDGVLSVFFGSGLGDGGLMVLRRNPAGGYAGTWAYFDPAEGCTETWTPQ
jgi:hypothetical protein